MSAASIEPLNDSPLQQQAAVLTEMLSDVKIVPSSGILRIFDEAHAADIATGMKMVKPRSSILSADCAPNRLAREAIIAYAQTTGANSTGSK